MGEEWTISARTPNLVALVWILNDCNCKMILYWLLLCAYTRLILIVLTVLLWLFCLIMPVLENINKLVYSTRAHQNTWGRVSHAWKRFQKRDNEVWNLCNTWDIQHGCQQVCRWTMAVLLCNCSGFPTKILEQMIVTSLYDATRVSHATVGGNYKRRAWPSLGAAITVIWVFWHKHLGL